MQQEEWKMIFSAAYHEFLFYTSDNGFCVGMNYSANLLTHFHTELEICVDF